MASRLPTGASDIGHRRRQVYKKPRRARLTGGGALLLAVVFRERE